MLGIFHRFCFQEKNAKQKHLFMALIVQTKVGIKVNKNENNILT